LYNADARAEVPLYGTEPRKAAMEYLIYEGHQRPSDPVNKLTAAGLARLSSAR
jgi:hypothetical protein